MRRSHHPPSLSCPFSQPLHFFFKILGGGQSPPPRIIQGGGAPVPPPLATPLTTSWVFTLCAQSGLNVFLGYCIIELFWGLLILFFSILRFYVCINYRTIHLNKMYKNIQYLLVYKHSKPRRTLLDNIKHTN